MLASILATLALLQDPAPVPTAAGALDSIRLPTVAVVVAAARDGAAPSADSTVSVDGVVATTVAAAPSAPDSAPALVLARTLPATLAPSPQPGVSRPKAVELSKGYETRLKIHRWGSYLMLPLFVGQYVLGAKLYDQREREVDGVEIEDGEDDSNTKDLHSLAAGGIAALFAVNTVTGVWNLYESRHIQEGRGKRIAHTVLMLAADAGFVATGLLGEEAGDEGEGGANTHRNVALASFGLATAGAALMWFWKD